MSYDAHVYFRACDHCGIAREPIEVGNMTSNVSDMYALALPSRPEGGGCYNGAGPSNPRAGLPGLSGLSCRDALPHLQRAVVYFLDHEVTLTKLEPANGWGSYESALAYLKRCRDACEENPTGRFGVNW